MFYKITQSNKFYQHPFHYIAAAFTSNNSQSCYVIQKITTLMFSSSINMHQFLVLLALLVFGISTPTQAQCGMEIFPQEAYQKLENYREIKGFRIDGKGGTRKVVEYTSVFSIKTFYRIVIAGKDGASQGTIVTIYNAKREKIASNYQNNTFNQALDFQVEESGIYYITFTFKDSKSYCGLARLASKIANSNDD